MFEVGKALEGKGARHGAALAERHTGRMADAASAAAADRIGLAALKEEWCEAAGPDEIPWWLPTPEEADGLARASILLTFEGYWREERRRDLGRRAAARRVT